MAKPLSAIKTAANAGSPGRIHVMKRSEPPPFDLRNPKEPWPQRRAKGKALRSTVPREGHSGWKPAKNRPSPLDLLDRSNAGRLEDLVPLRMGRMAESPFAFLRGSAVVMA